MHLVARFFPEGDPRVDDVCDFVERLKQRTAEYTPPVTWIPGANAVETILVGELHYLKHENTGTLFDANVRARTYDDCDLQKRSIYRAAQDYMSSPLGLCSEPLVWQRLREVEFQCPECRGTDIQLGGGSKAAWADMVCPCGTFFEIKTVNKWVMKGVVNRNQLRGGSYKYFGAQRRHDVKHYMLVVPKEGGNVLLKRIKYVQPKIDAKLLAFHKCAPEEASLKSHAVLERDTRNLFIGHPLDDYEQECKYIASTLLRLFFAHDARIIQKCWKYGKKNVTSG